MSSTSVSALKIRAALSNHLRFGSEPVCINGATPSASVNWAACYQFIGTHQPSAAAGIAGGTQSWCLQVWQHSHTDVVRVLQEPLLNYTGSAERLLDVAGWVRTEHNHSLLPPQHESSPGPSFSLCPGLPGYSRCLGSANVCWGLSNFSYRGYETLS